MKRVEEEKEVVMVKGGGWNKRGGRRAISQIFNVELALIMSKCI